MPLVIHVHVPVIVTLLNSLIIHNFIHLSAAIKIKIQT